MSIQMAFVLCAVPGSIPEYGVLHTCLIDVGLSAVTSSSKVACPVLLKLLYTSLTSMIVHNGELRNSRAIRIPLHRSLQLAVTAVL